MSIVEDISAALVAGGYSNTRAYRFDSSTIPQICIIPGGGTVDMIASTDGRGTHDLTRPNVQIQVRDASLATVDARAKAIITLLHRAPLSGYVACWWNGRQPDMRVDENNLYIFSIEFKIIKSGA